jgi:tripartite-type tricarboxylate transporter receptor subunit TctC
MAMVAMVCALSAAQAQNYPNHTIRIIVPIAPGGASDILSRLLAQKLYESWGQIAQVDNRPGASGIIGSELVAKAPADGYTLLLAFTSHVTNPTLQPRLPYDTRTDFAPVSMIAVVPSVLIVHPSLPVHSVQELIAFAKRRPGDLDYASSGTGTATHLAALMFSAMTGVMMEHVPYRGGAPALNELLGGQVSLMFGNLASSMAFIRAGRLRPLAVTSARRAAMLPQVPTMIEAGLPGYEALAWFALLAPAQTPGQVINKLNSEVVAILQHPDMRKRLESLGVEIRPSTPAELHDYILTEIVKWEKVIKQLRVKPMGQGG